MFEITVSLGDKRFPFTFTCESAVDAYHAFLNAWKVFDPHGYEHGFVEGRRSDALDKLMQNFLDYKSGKNISHEWYGGHLKVAYISREQQKEG